VDASIGSAPGTGELPPFACGCWLALAAHASSVPEPTPIEALVRADGLDYCVAVTMRIPVPQVDDDRLVARRVTVSARHVAYVKSILEASEGLACMFAERGGELLMVAPVSRQAELDVLVEDLRVELGALVDP
jgi:hypothetical protein